MPLMYDWGSPESERNLVTTLPLERLANLHQRGPKRTVTQHLDLPLSIDLRWNGYEPSNGNDRQNAESFLHLLCLPALRAV
jgi:hypothetical protein